MRNLSELDDVPKGLKLKFSLAGHENAVKDLAWAPRGQILASGAQEGIRLWDLATGECKQELNTSWVKNLAWSPDGSILAAVTGDIEFWKSETDQFVKFNEITTGLRQVIHETLLAWSPAGELIAYASGKDLWLYKVTKSGRVRVYTLFTTREDICSLRWSPDGSILAVGQDQGIFQLWSEIEAESWEPVHGTDEIYTWRYSYLDGWDLHRYEPGLFDFPPSILSIAWSPDSEMLAAGYSRKRVGIWYTSTRKEDDSLASQYLEGHRGSVTSLSFSPNSDILAYGAADGSVRLWRCDGWDLLAVLHEASGDSWYTRRKNAFPGCVAFNPSGTLLATLADKGRVIKIWELDTETLLSMAPSTGTAHYANAKVVLAGNTGVGKTGLGRVLAGEPFAPTESTHGRHV